MKLRWAARARQDRAAVMEYIESDSPAAAIALDDLFEAHAESARTTPTLYRPGRVKGTREIVVHPNYVMIYRITADSVDILRVLHAAQQWPPLED